jgi:tetratricopeptide (TPR) repeat protein
MPFWPFKRKPPTPTSPQEVRQLLINTAATGSAYQLKDCCEQFKSVVAANLEFMCKAPVDIRNNEVALNREIQCLGRIAQCLAQECAAPELWNQLVGPPESNPLARWDAWYGELPHRMARLEHEQLITEALKLIAEAQGLKGSAATQNEAFLVGRLGELQFHSGKVAEALPTFSRALEICREINDLTGQRVHLNNLLESHRYLGNIEAAINTGWEAIRIAENEKWDSSLLRTRVQRMKQGEPRCRVILMRDGQELELAEISNTGDGRYQFHFRRNRLSLGMAETLVEQGKKMASDGKLADALEKFSQASEIDPHDPDPVYQAGGCLLDLGAFSQARARFAEVDELAPGWFRCRFDRWLAESLERGEVSPEAYQVLRVLDDGNLPPREAQPIAAAATQRFPDFAPFQLSLGEILSKMGDTESALRAFRRGLELVREPDLESRLLCAIAGLSPHDTAASRKLLERATALDGSLVAHAMIALMCKR